MSYELDVDALTEEDAKAMTAASERMARGERPSFEWSQTGGLTAFVGIGWAWCEAGERMASMGRDLGRYDGGSAVRVADLAPVVACSRAVAKSPLWRRAVDAQAGGDEAWERWRAALDEVGVTTHDVDLFDAPGDDEGTMCLKALLRAVVNEVLAAVEPLSRAAVMEAAEDRGKMQAAFSGPFASGLSLAAWAGDAAGVIELGGVIEAARLAGVGELLVVAG